LLCGLGFCGFFFRFFFFFFFCLITFITFVGVVLLTCEPAIQKQNQIQQS